MQGLVGDIEIQLSVAAFAIGDRPTQHGDDLVLCQDFQTQQCRAADEGGVAGEEGVLGGRADERDRAAFDIGEEDVLLGLGEPVDLVEEEDGALAFVLKAGIGLIDDLADACVYLMDHYSNMTPINVGCGKDISIADLAAIIARTVNFKGQLRFDASRPDGTPRKLLDIARLTALGWQPRIRLLNGIQDTIEWYRSQKRLQPALR